MYKLKYLWRETKCTIIQGHKDLWNDTKWMLSVENQVSKGMDRLRTVRNEANTVGSVQVHPLFIFHCGTPIGVRTATVSVPFSQLHTVVLQV
jgi:hypothetical protein